MKKLAALLIALTASLVAASAVYVLDPDLYALHRREFARVEDRAGICEVSTAQSPEWRAATAQTRLGRWGKARTGAASGCALVFADGSRLVLGENAKVTLRPLRFNRLTRARTISGRVAYGRARASAASEAGRRLFEVRNPTVVLSVRGTTFETEVSDRGDSVTEVMEGTVWAMSDGKVSELGRGSKASFARDRVEAYRALSLKMARHLPLLASFSPHPGNLARLRGLAGAIPAVKTGLEAVSKLRAAGLAPTPRQCADLLRGMPRIDDILRHTPTRSQQELLISLLPDPDELRDLFLNAPAEMRASFPSMAELKELARIIPEEAEVAALLAAAPGPAELEAARRACPEELWDRIPGPEQAAALAEHVPGAKAAAFLKEYVRALERMGAHR